ncbi:MAG: hypothetical protein DWQ04_07130 [Chloroflexi bacterium]|nr:MAG: hypothetical protein DWQ04_07130 [Chloroflexota bacterium]
MLITCLTSTIVYWQLNQKAAAVTEQLSVDVVGVHQLVMETAVSHDMDLFESLFHAPSSQWSKNQFELIARDLYLNRAPLGLWFDSTKLISQTITTENVSTNFLPDFQRVEVLVEQPYLMRSSDDTIEPVVLVNTAVYQKKDNSWLLAAPDETFWGNELQAESSIIITHYPARDAEIAEKLTADLNNLVVMACEKNIFPCPNDLSLDLYLETEESSLLGLNRRFQLPSRYGTKTGRRHSFTLPTPTLVGLPVDEAGYQALYQGFGAQLLAALIVNLHPNFQQEIRNQSFLVQQLAKMDFSLPEPVGFHPMETAVPPPIPFPNQNILLSCREAGQPLIHYNLQTNKWTPAYVEWLVTSLIGLDNGDGALLTVVTDTGRQIRWWQPDRERILLEETQDIFVNNAFLFPDEDADNKHVINFYSQSEGMSQWLLLDENNCTENSCELEEITEWSMASPNGRFRLIISLESDGWTRQISLEDVESGERTTYGLGFSPGWIDDETFVYIRVADSAPGAYPTQSTLVIVDAAQSENNVSEITVDDISDAVNEFIVLDATQEQFSFADYLIGGVLPGPDDHWLLMLFESGTTQFSLAYLVEYASETGQMSIFENLHQFETAVFLSSSQDNQYFSIAVLDLTGVAMRLYDVQQNQYRSYSVPSAWQGGYAWTMDGDWLLLVEEDGIRLVAPAHDYERRIVHDFGRCETAVWINTP